MRRQLLLLFIVSSITVIAQEIPSNRVLKLSKLPTYLKEGVTNNFKGKITESELANYFRNKFSERFFYDYTSFDLRFTIYKRLYGNKLHHTKRAQDHLSKYNGDTNWKLPFNYLNGKPVNAYALRHLARQHKMVDIALYYHYNGKDPKYIQYFENQMQSLNAALEKGAYEKIEDGNGVYEAFRSGYRVLNWLWIHNMFLNETEYSDKDQLTTIATLLQHGQHLYEKNQKFHAGNHQTRGVSALAMLSILLRDFEGTDKWYELAMERLGEHLDKEINADGFQFERSIHYHMSDINNYYYVYQLAKISNISIDKSFEEKLKSLFTTLVKIAYPDKSAPVLQDDTEIPWADKNDISGSMTLGYLLFEDPEFGYFATNKVNKSMYWFLNNSQIALLNNIQQKKPTYGSLSFDDTHYYVMREGWEKNDNMLVISAGVDDKKPDHQHGDILGIQAMANGQVVLPNYQVRYSLKDFDLFKNSMVKNVALVDDELQGKKWTSNKGGSGFGKFKQLPNPKVIAWKSAKNFDFFAGSHDGFENIDVNYSRQVISVANDFWIVKDAFSGNNPHEYKQVWQGHYTTEESPNLLRATFPDASGLDIYQLQPLDAVTSSGKRGKEWNVVSKKNITNFNFITVIFPYKGYSNRIDELSTEVSLKDWKVNQSSYASSDKNIISIRNNKKEYLFNVKQFSSKNISIQLSDISDLFIENTKEKLILYSLATKSITVDVKELTDKKRTKQVILSPGEFLEFDY